MGLSSVLDEFGAVYDFLGGVWLALPNMIQFLIYLVFGVVILIAVIRSLWG